MLALVAIAIGVRFFARHKYELLVGCLAFHLVQYAIFGHNNELFGGVMDGIFEYGGGRADEVSFARKLLAALGVEEHFGVRVLGFQLL